MDSASNCDASLPVELNVGGVVYTTSKATLTNFPNSKIARMFESQGAESMKDAKGRYFIDRDGVLFRFILDYLRNKKLVLPECFQEKERLVQEAKHFGLDNLVTFLTGAPPSSKPDVAPYPTSLADRLLEATTLPRNSIHAFTDAGKEKGYITIAYRGTFAFGRDGLADVKFRKLSRILICGRVSLCREVFGETLNESRDPDRGVTDRYSARFYLKHAFIEQAFDMLDEAGFQMVGSCASGTNSCGELKPGMESEEAKWNHYNEFVFCRR